MSKKTNASDPIDLKPELRDIAGQLAQAQVALTAALGKLFAGKAVVRCPDDGCNSLPHQQSDLTDALDRLTQARDRVARCAHRAADLV